MRITTEHPNPYIATAEGDGFVVVHSHTPIAGHQVLHVGHDGARCFQMDFMAAADYENDQCNPEAYDPWCDAYEVCFYVAHPS